MHPDYNKDVLKCDLNVESVGWFVILRAFAQILLAHPLVSSQVASTSSLTLLVIVEPHNSCTSCGMASDPAVLTERTYVTAMLLVRSCVAKERGETMLASITNSGFYYIQF